MLATLIPAGRTLLNQGIKQSVRDRDRAESGTWRRCRVRRLDVLRAAGSSQQLPRRQLFPEMDTQNTGIENIDANLLRFARSISFYCLLDCLC